MGIEEIQIECTWHETREPYVTRIREPNPAMMLRRVRDEVAAHNLYGRTFRIIGLQARGTRVVISEAQLARMG